MILLEGRGLINSFIVCETQSLVIVDRHTGETRQHALIFPPAPVTPGRHPMVSSVAACCVLRTG